MGGTVCSKGFEAGNTITLTASPDTNSLFTGWSDANGTVLPECPGNPSTCSVLMNNAMTVRATFSLPHFDVYNDGDGSGLIESTPTGIYCGTDCSHDYNKGTNLSLRATPDPKSLFVKWTSFDCTVTVNGTCDETLYSNGWARAKFQKNRLTVSKTGVGNNIVQSSDSPQTINCGSTCAADYNAASSVTLSAVPNAYSIFTGWSAACTNVDNPCTVPVCPGTDSCLVSMNGAASVTGNFVSYGLGVNIQKISGGSGTITSVDGGINCPGDCGNGYANGTIVRLTAIPASGSRFNGWPAQCQIDPISGDCSITITGANIVSSTFTKVYYEDTDPAITYSGTWSSSSCASCSGGSMKSSTTIGASASFTFTGSAVKGIFTKGSNMGLAYVYVDGAYFTSIDLYSATTQYQTFRMMSLTSGQHTIRIEVSGVKNTYSSGILVNVDAIEVTP